MPHRPLIGVFGHYGNRNLGDEAIVAATIEQIRRRLKDAEIVCFSLRPNDSAPRHGVESFSIYHAPEFPGPVFPGDARTGTQQSEPDAGAAENRIAGQTATLKERLKTLPLVGPWMKLAASCASKAIAAAGEVGFIVRSAAYLRRFDLLIIAGSNQFLDNFQGTWGFPYALLKWSILAKLARTKLVYASVGAGPLDRRLSKFFVRTAVALSDYASYRDTPSKALVEAGWPRVDCPVFPDLAFGLNDAGLCRTRSAKGKLVVGVNPMPVFDKRYWFEHDDARYRQYVDTIAGVSARLFRSGHRVFFFPTMWRDNEVIEDVLALLRETHDLDLDPRACYESCEQVDDLVAALQRADIVVSTRFHGIVLPFSLGIPVLGIGYYRKSLALMTEMGQENYYEALDDCTVDSLWRKFVDLEAHWQEEQRTIAEKTADYRKQISVQWDAVLRLVAESQNRQAP